MDAWILKKCKKFFAILAEKTLPFFMLETRAF